MTVRSLFATPLIFLAGCAAATPPPTTPAAERDALPALSLVDLDGQSVQLETLKGQVVWLDFWATWCPPCLDSLPVYDRWQTELGEKGLKVVAVSVDEARDEVGPFLAKYAPNVIGWHDPQGRSAEILGLPTMPTAFLLDRSGRVVLRKQGFEPSEEAALKARVLEILEAPAE